MNHKRKKPKNARAGCLMCKYWKVNGVSVESAEGEKFSDHRRRTTPQDSYEDELFTKDLMEYDASCQ